MVVSVSKTLEDGIDNDTRFNFCNQFSKLNRMLVGQKLAFSKKCKNMSTKPEIVSDVTFKAWPFSSDFNFACKDCRVTAARCKHYYPLVVKLTITNCCKQFHLKCGRVPRSLFENIAMHKN